MRERESAVGLWDQIRDALSAVWADIQSSNADEHAQLVTWLIQAGRAEHGLSMQILQIIPAVPYEQFRRRLEVIARDDAQHATFIQEHLGPLGGMPGYAVQASEGTKNNLPSGPWQRLQQVLTVKRELYERYRQAASVADDPDVRSLLEWLRDDEARHQDELITMLTQLDAHVHETIA
jgi:bacterioferritin (cytochrome b1)